MATSTTAKRVQLFVACFVGAALLLRLGLTIFDPEPDLDPHVLVRLERFISYFTIQSNIVVLLASLAVVAGKPLDEPWWKALRLASLVGITVTGIVYVVVLAGDANNTGLGQVANLMLHYIAPPLTVVAWLAFGPWPDFKISDIPRTLIWPLMWIVYTLIHGAVTDWYPYPFIDVVTKGYGKVTVNIVAITIFAIVLSLVFIGLSRLRRRGSAPPESPRSAPH
jgi:hypothetical protein